MGPYKSLLYCDREKRDLYFIKDQLWSTVYVGKMPRTIIPSLEIQIRLRLWNGYGEELSCVSFYLSFKGVSEF